MEATHGDSSYRVGLRHGQDSARAEFAEIRHVLERRIATLTSEITQMMETDPDTVIVDETCGRCCMTRTCIDVGDYGEDPHICNTLCRDCLIELSLFLSKAIKEAGIED